MKEETRKKISKSMEGNKNSLKYKGDESDKLIYNLCLLGLTDKEISTVLEINEDTFNEWKKIYPSVSESIMKGKHIADINVVKSLYKRAVGFEYDAVKIFQNQGEEVIVPYKEYVIPDVTAQKKWLSARQRKIWSESLSVNGGQDENGNDKPIQMNHNLPEWLRVEPKKD